MGTLATVRLIEGVRLIRRPLNTGFTVVVFCILKLKQNFNVADKNFGYFPHFEFPACCHGNKICGQKFKMVVRSNFLKKIRITIILIILNWNLKFLS